MECQKDSPVRSSQIFSDACILVEGGIEGALKKLKK